MSRTDIATLGEFGLIERLTNDLRPQNDSTLRGVGDDCAVLHYPDREVLVTTDLLLEGIHFDLTYVPLRHLGYKAVMVNLSDICAMNGTPRQITVSLGLSRKFSVEAVEELYDGMRLACSRCGVDIVGGDTVSSLTGLTISITAIGEARRDDIVYRNGARPTDLVCVSGNLGAAYMGLQLLERERAVWADTERSKGLKVEESKGTEEAFAGKEYILERQLKPEARLDIVRTLAAAGIRPTSMMDISDGLSSELLHICRQSGCGCRIYEDRIPIDYETAVMAEELNMNVTTCALNGGEDYELLFTVPLADYDRVEALDADIHLIGHITEPAAGNLLVTRDGTEITLRAQGFTAFS